MNNFSFRKLQWADKAHTKINMEAIVPWLPNEWIPLCLHADYDLAYGREIFAEALTGGLGAIAEFHEPVEVTVKRYERLLDNHLDSVAKSRRWDSRFTFVARAAYQNPWQDEAVAFGIWMDTCNAQAYALLQSVQEGTVTAPSEEEFIASLPNFNYP